MQTTPYYRADLLAEMQNTLAELADIAVQQEIEREQSNGNEGQAPLSNPA